MDIHYKQMGFKVDQRPTNLFNLVHEREVLMKAAKSKNFGSRQVSTFAESYFLKKPDHFIEFEAKCNTGAITSDWLNHFSDAGIMHTLMKPIYVIHSEQSASLLKAMSEMAMRVAIESTGGVGGKARPQIGTGGSSEVHTKAGSKPKLIDLGSKKSK